MKKLNNERNSFIKTKYQITAHFYDLLDYPWEKKIYQYLRPILLKDLVGDVLEAGVGTGRNLAYYPDKVKLTAIDLSPSMLNRAKARGKKVGIKANFIQTDACEMSAIDSNKYDYYISTFMYCVMPDKLQPLAISEMARILKPDGKFRLVEMVYSKQPHLLRRQKLLERWVEKVYGARFDRNTHEYIASNPDLDITNTTYLQDDTYLLIEGRKKS